MSVQPDPFDALREYGVSPTHRRRPRGSGAQPRPPDGAPGDSSDQSEAAAGRAPDPARMVPPPGNPMAVARHFVGERFTVDETVLIRAWRGGFRCWDGRCWPERDEASVRADAYRYLEHAACASDGKLQPWDPTKHKIANVLEALKAVTELPATVQPPAWIGKADPNLPDPRDLLVTANGILHVPTRELQRHDPRLFVGHAVPFAYDAAAPPPARWLAFLDELWHDDEESIALLQEMFGYVISGDTSLQKILLLVGPTRAGKGVIANTLEGLIGHASVGAPTLSALTMNFGLQDLIGKALAVVSDARLGPRADLQALAERLLSISGEDAITIDRKYRDPWTGRLGVRFLLLTNELPRFADASGALARRFAVLVLTETFYGREDPALLAKLLAELPGILNWALDGLDRLRVQGRFTQPASAQEAIGDLQDLASPISAFVRDRCRVRRDQRVSVDELWKAWKAWCDDQSQHHGTKQTFGRDLHAAVPGLRISRPRDDDRQRVYLGVGLRGSDDNNGGDRGPRGPSGPANNDEGPDQPPEPRGPGSPRSAPPSSPGPTVHCSDYRAHQSFHRQDAGAWVCDACQPSR